MTERAEKALSALLTLMAHLRHPTEGCAWDVQQTHETIAPYTIEEAYEVADAIRHGTPEDLKQELGDLLLQVIFQARIAEEAGNFDFADIALAITEKMTNRHPHVFGSSPQRSAEEQKRIWENIKAEERKAKTQTATLDDVPVALPPITRAFKLQKRAARVGFDWPDAESVLDKIDEELSELCGELKATPQSSDKIQEELGDLLFTIVNLARKLGVDPDSALTATNEKFIKRFALLEKMAAQQNTALKDVSLETMENWWQAAKQNAD